jgi:dTMP kinase
VLADRYIYTAYARDITRGCSPDWVHRIYNFAMRPDIVFYFRTPIDVGISRILAGRPQLKYYEAGMDLNLSKDPYDSYRIFQTRIIEQYESMITSEKFTIIDATLGIEEQQNMMRAKVLQILPKKLQKQTIELKSDEGRKK